MRKKLEREKTSSSDLRILYVWIKTHSSRKTAQKSEAARTLFSQKTNREAEPPTESPHLHVSHPKVKQQNLFRTMEKINKYRHKVKITADAVNQRPNTMTQHVWRPTLLQF